MPLGRTCSAPVGNGHGQNAKTKEIFSQRTRQAQSESNHDRGWAFGPSPEEVHSNLMLRHILSSSQDSSDGCNFRYSDALQAQLKVHYQEKVRDCEPTENSSTQVSRGYEIDSRDTPQHSTVARSNGQSAEGEDKKQLGDEHASGPEGLQPDVKREDRR